MKYNCRCTTKKCRQRVTLNHHPTWYIRVPKCPSCKTGRLSYDPAPALQTIKRTCRCGGVHYPHKRGLYLNDNEFCEHALIDMEFGGLITAMKPTDDCPF